jgi:hypothetical protein
MLLSFTDVVSKGTIHINPKYIVAVFTVADGEFKGHTAITLTNGNLVVEDTDSTVVGTVNSALIANQ